LRLTGAESVEIHQTQAVVNHAWERHAAAMRAVLAARGIEAGPEDAWLLHVADDGEYYLRLRARRMAPLRPSPEPAPCDEEEPTP
jgi:hypothetical protein